MKYYAVKKGHQVGVYTTWKECQAQVKGFSGAIFKSFVSHDEALRFVKQVEKPLKFDRVFYTDGSYRDGKSGGCAIDVKARKIYTRRTSEETKEQTNNRGELTGIILALENSAVGESVHIFTDSQYSINILQEGYTSSDNIDMVEKVRALVSERRLTLFLEYVQAHCGIEYNEMADKYAVASLQNQTCETAVIDF